MQPTKIPPRSHKAPWNVPLSERISALSSLHRGRKRVVYLYEYPDSSTFRYRIYNMCQALELSDCWHGVYFFECELSRLKPFLNEIDAIVIVRMRWSFELEEFINLATQKNVPLIFDCDDLVFDPSSTLLVLHTLNQDQNCEQMDRMFAYIGRINETAKQCRSSIGTNAFLCSQLERVLCHKSFPIANFMNREQLAISTQYRDACKNNNKFSLGYFSGSPTHFFDLDSISDEIYEFLTVYQDAELHLVGHINAPEILKPLERKGRIKRLPFVSFLELQKLISSVDVNLVPLQLNHFTHCKSELKFFEAAAVAVPTCASPTFVYKNAIQEGVTGLICDQGSWFKALQSLKEEKFNRQIGHSAMEYCLLNYSPQAFCKKIEATLDSCIS